MYIWREGGSSRQDQDERCQECVETAQQHPPLFILPSLPHYYIHQKNKRNNGKERVKCASLASQSLFRAVSLSDDFAARLITDSLVRFVRKQNKREIMKKKQENITHAHSMRHFRESRLLIIIITPYGDCTYSWCIGYIRDDIGVT